ncbi:MAG: hypothetical protein J6A92_07995 [Lachnospiraceae bacterium]|nr:hypothetical protein [Lachnospiraceae bacterium]
MYKCSIDKDKFIQECVDAINEYLKYKKVKNTYSEEDGRGTFNDAGMFVMEENIYGGKEVDIEMTCEPKSDFEIANYIMYHTMLPRLAIFKIMKGLKKRELLNNQDILDMVTQKILQKLKDEKAEHITSYEVIEGYEQDSRSIFECDTIAEEDFTEEWRVFHAKGDNSSAMNEYYKMDSKGEKEFAEELEKNKNVVMFTKMKKGGFVINTPYGNYSPDWAVVCRKEGLSEPELGIYFIVETKKGKEYSELQDKEKRKIKCGIKHFAAVSKQIRFDWVKDYKDFKDKFGVADFL